MEEETADSIVRAAVPSDITGKIAEFFRLKDESAKHKKLKEDYGSRADKLGIEIIERMESDSITQIKDVDGHVVYIQKPKLYASFKPGQKEDALKVIKEDWGLPELVQEGIAPSTLNTIIKERIEKGDPVPDGLFSTYFKKTLGHRRK